VDEEKDFYNLVKKFKAKVAKEELDLSTEEDLVLAITNLISIEEHLFFTAEKTGKVVYLDILNEVREMRKKLLKKIIKDYEGEVWCISKHLLAGTMRLMEVGTKYLSQNKKEEAKNYFDDAYTLWTLFWGIHLKIINPKEIPVTLSADFLNDSGNLQKVAEKESLTKREKEPESKNQTSKENRITEKNDSSSLLRRLSTIIQKAIDCCRE